MRVSATLRPWLLLPATLAALWASSVFTPWAVDPEPRLWLYDLLFYLRFALLFWGAAEALRLALRRGPARDAIPVVAAACVAVVALGHAHTGTGMRWKVAASQAALAAAAHAGDSDQRRRLGHFIVDDVRVPCAGTQQAWLWLGRPHGGGTGTNIALVWGAGRRPATPLPDAFAFWPAGHGWWVAYQHAGRFHAGSARGSAGARHACSPGALLARHRQGVALVVAGRRALPE
ncbi:hypothetical protein MQC88_11565 [Luteimonas sp. 50]|uniref:Uncharacterized protein n=1 Tax=Cognatiluteimonas sedimenti TaxID=2927791 RepID=A0ABT0A6L0_9GAMM|nr:hypothetical protein [Lysobacter sedimenti]MCJ0826580.1 hypothetical protein [Lysobacter sedimenti]